MKANNKKNIYSKYVLLAFGLALFYYAVCYISAKKGKDHIVSTNQNINQPNILSSLAKNSTILNAFTDINKGYFKLNGKSKLSMVTSGFVNSNLQKREVFNATEGLDQYMMAVLKYHRFFESYVHKFNFENMYLIEAKNTIVLYTPKLNEELLKPYSDLELNKTIREAGKNKNKGRVISRETSKGSQVFSCIAVYNRNKIIGYIATVK